MFDQSYRYLGDVSKYGEWVFNYREWDLTGKDKVPKFTPVPNRQCTLDDFGVGNSTNSTRPQKFFDAPAQYVPILKASYRNLRCMDE